MSTTTKPIQIIPPSSSTTPQPILFTCEHAGQDLPSHVDKSHHERFLNLHWAYDPGARELTEALCLATGAPGIFCHTSRLYCDVNRPVGSDTLARKECDGVPVPMNQNVDLQEREKRIREIWLPYHLSVSDLANKIKATKICSVHSFTPVYEGNRRDHVEIGVLSSFEDDLALRVKSRLEADGFERVLLNVPWSGKRGIMFSADCVGFSSSVLNRSTVMLEVRNDLLIGPKSKSFIPKMVHSLMKVLI
jgi:predicted N-formylglutamate amidohydrolase